MTDIPSPFWGASILNAQNSSESADALIFGSLRSGQGYSIGEGDRRLPASNTTSATGQVSGAMQGMPDAMPRDCWDFQHLGECMVHYLLPLHQIMV
jgi:hypothetical protein